MSSPALRVSGVDVYYGKIRALSDINIELLEGETVGLLGANGAGKTTMLNTISGFLRPASGTLELFGRPIQKAPPHAIVREGLLQLSQERDLFDDLTVLENLRLGSFSRAAKSFDQNAERVFRYFPRLRERSGQRASTMSGGEQQMLAIARALMAEPKVLLFDEPSAGLSPKYVQEISAMMLSLRREGGITIMLVEQNIPLTAQVVDRFYMLRAGELVAKGLADELKDNQEELARKYYL